MFTRIKMILRIVKILFNTKKRGNNRSIGKKKGRDEII